MERWRCARGRNRRLPLTSFRTHTRAKSFWRSSSSPWNSRRPHSRARSACRRGGSTRSFLASARSRPTPTCGSPGISPCRRGIFLGLQTDYELMHRRRQIGDQLKQSGRGRHRRSEPHSGVAPSLATPRSRAWHGIEVERVKATRARPAASCSFGGMATMPPADAALQVRGRLGGVEVAPALEGAPRRGAHGDELVLQDQQAAGRAVVLGALGDVERAAGAPARGP